MNGMNRRGFLGKLGGTLAGALLGRKLMVPVGPTYPEILRDLLGDSAPPPSDCRVIYFNPDCIHPTEAGYAEVAALLTPYTPAG